MKLCLKRCVVFLLTIFAQSAAAGVTETQASAHRAAIDWQILGSGTPVGVQGVYFMYGFDPKWEFEIGAGRGTVGNHATVNSRHFFGADSSSHQKYWLAGASYSGGIKAKPAEDDYDLDGAVGMKKQVADALWLNASVGYVFQRENGFRLLFDAGLALAVVTGIKIKAKDATESRKRCDFFPCEAPTIRTGSVSPAITILRVGYGF